MKTILPYTNNTKDIIVTAYLKLLSKNNIDKITVKQIIQVAGISRSTFYLHFESKFGVIDYITEITVEEFTRIFLEKIQEHESQPDKFEEELIRLATNMLVHLYHHLSFYKIQVTNDINFFNLLNTNIETSLYKSLHNATLSQFIASGMTGNIQKWIINDEIELETIESLSIVLKTFSIYSIQLIKLNCEGFSE